MGEGVRVKAVVVLICRLRWAGMVCMVVFCSAPLGWMRETETLVELPPFMVEADAAKPWRYAAVPGAEILSRCPDEITRQMIQRQYRLHELLTLLVPPELQVHRSQPRYFVFYNSDQQSLVNRDMVAKLEAQEQALQSAGKMQVGPELHVGYLPNFRFWDQDSLAIFFVINPLEQDREDFTLAASYVRYLLAARAPALPDWFIEGLLSVYAHTELAVPPLQSALDIMASAQRIGGPRVERDEIRIRRFTPALFGLKSAPLKKKDPPAQLAPVAEVFGASSGHYDATKRRATAAVFIRWALDPGRLGSKAAALRNPRHSKGPASQAKNLWALVERTAKSEMSESLLSEYFDLDYAQLDATLQAYAPVSMAEDFTLKADRPITLAKVELRDATVLETSRIHGELTRLEIDYVRELFPVLVESYSAQARRILRRAYDVGERDSRLLASLGICEVDARDDGAALPFLRAATESGVARPRAWYELARIEFERLVGAKGKAKPTSEDLRRVLEHLGTARGQRPFMPEVYELYARIWSYAEMPLGKNILTVLNSGLHLFPHRVGLLHQVALLMAQHGRTDEAKALVERALVAATNSGQRQILEELQGKLRAANYGSFGWANTGRSRVCP